MAGPNGTPVLDSFPTNGASLGVNWTANPGNVGGLTTMRVSGGVALADAGGFSSNYYSALQFPANQEVFATLAVMPTTGNCRLYCRLNGANNGNGYGIVIDSGGVIDFYTITGGLPDTHIGGSSGAAAGHKFAIVCNGTTISFWHDTGGGWSSINSFTDSTYNQAGYGGMYMSNTTVGAWDDFGGGSLSTTFSMTLKAVNNTVVYPYQNVPVPYSLFDGSCRDAQGRFYVSEGFQTQNHVLQFTTPLTDLTQYNVITIPDTTVGGLVVDTTQSTLAYDPVNDCVYSGVTISGANGGAHQPYATIYKITPSSAAITRFITASGIGQPGNSFGETNVVCTDGTYLYALYSGNNVNTWIYKYQCSDGSGVAKIRLPAGAGGVSAKQGSVLGFQTGNGTGFLYAAGNGQNASGQDTWVAQIPTSLASAIVTCYGTFAGGTMVVPNDDAVGVGNYFYFGDEGSPGQVWKIANDTSSAVSITVSGTLFIDSISYDGEYIYAIDGYGTVNYIDPNTFTLASINTAAVGLPLDDHINEAVILSSGTGMLAATYNFTHPNTRALLIPLSKPITLTKKITKAPTTIGTGGSTSIFKSLPKLFSSICSGAVTIVKSVGKVRLGVSPTIVSLAIGAAQIFSRTISVVSTSSVSLLKQINKPISYIASTLDGSNFGNAFFSPGAFGTGAGLGVVKQVSKSFSTFIDSFGTGTFGIGGYGIVTSLTKKVGKIRAVLSPIIASVATGGGQSFSRTISAISTTSVTLNKSIFKFITALAIVTASLLKSIGKGAFSIVDPTTASIQNRVGKTLGILTSAPATIVKQISKFVSSSTASSDSLSKSTGVSKSAVDPTTTTTQKQVGKIEGVTQPTLVSVQKFIRKIIVDLTNTVATIGTGSAQTFARTISVVVNSPTTLSKTVLKIFTVLASLIDGSNFGDGLFGPANFGTTAIQFTKQITKNLAISIDSFGTGLFGNAAYGTVVGLVKTVNKRVTATCATVVSTLTGGVQTFLRTISVVVTTNTSVVKSIRKNIVALCSGVVNLIRGANTTLSTISVVVSSPATLRKLVQKPLIIISTAAYGLGGYGQQAYSLGSAVITTLTNTIVKTFSTSSVVSASVRKQVNKTFSILSSSATSLSRGCGKGLVAVVNTTTTVQKQIRKNVVSICQTVISFSKNGTTTFLSTISTAIPTTTTVSKFISKGISFTSVTNVVISKVKVMFRTIAASVSTNGIVIKGISKFIQGSTTTSTSLQRTLGIIVRTISLTVSNSTSLTKSIFKNLTTSGSTPTTLSRGFVRFVQIVISVGTTASVSFADTLVALVSIGFKMTGFVFRSRLIKTVGRRIGGKIDSDHS